MLARLFAAALVGGVLIRWARRRRIYSVDLSSALVWREFRGALGMSAIDAVIFVGVHQLGWVRFAPAATPTSLLLTFVGIFAWFEVSHFGLHRALHLPGLYAWHRRHHEARVTHPLTGFVFGGVERALQTALGLGGIALVSASMPIDQVALEAYLVLSYVLNGVAHANVELTPPGWTRRGVGAFFITTTFHALHHTRFNGHYGLYTTLLDRLAGTVFPDHHEVHDAAARGDGLTSPSTRLAVPVRAETNFGPGPARALTLEPLSRVG